ncbi:MAG: hypothetical protein KJ645_04105, partial [Planctomycetes bacterium]|nr:hypothetical protein [Planctomycetota bacterium]
RHRTYSWCGGLLTVILTLGACFSKESGVMAGALLLVLILSRAHHSTGHLLGHALLAALSAAGYLWIRSNVLGGLQGQVPLYGGDFLSNAIFASAGLAQQISLLFRGFRLSVEYAEPAGQALSMGVALPALTFLVLSTGGIIWLRRLRAHRFLTGSLFFLVALFPTSSLVFPMNSPCNDRYLYVAMIGLGLAAGAATERLRHLRSNKIGTRGCVLGTVLIITLLGLCSSIRCLDWRTGERLWKSTLARHSESIKARVGLSRIYFNQGRTREALQWAQEAVDRAKPGTAVRWDALHLAASALKRQGLVEEAAVALRQVLAEAAALGDEFKPDPRFLETCRNLWAIEMEAGRFENALIAADRLLQHEGRTHLNLLLQAEALKGLGRVKEVEEILRDAERARNQERG